MLVELDRICDLIEWRIEPNRIVGRLRMRDVNTERSVTMRLAGYSVHDRLRRRTEAQVSIAIEIIKDVHHGRLFDTKQLVDNQSAHDEPKPDGGSGDKPAPKAPRRAQSKNKKRSRRDAGGSAD